MENEYYIGILQIRYIAINKKKWCAWFLNITGSNELYLCVKEIRYNEIDMTYFIVWSVMHFMLYVNELSVKHN